MIDATDKFTTICFEITNHCNKNCKFCTKMTGDKYKIRYTKLEDYKYVISCINKKDRENFRKVVITGGEPILHPHFIELMNLVREDFPKAEIKVQSNGRLIKRLPQKKLRILPDIKKVIFSVSHYPGWNDEIKEKYDGNIKTPSIYRRIIRKLTKNNEFIKLICLDYRIPFIKKLRRFISNPFKRGNVYFKDFTGFRDPYIDPNLTKERAKIVRKACHYMIWIIDKKLYSCCVDEVYERFYNTKSISIKFDKNWKKDYFKLPTWRACAHCPQGYNRYKVISLGYEKFTLISLKERLQFARIKNHA